MDAVVRLLGGGASLAAARIVSSSNDHCLLLTLRPGDLVAVKSGFGSGPLGEGPSGFSHLLALLRAHRIAVDEIDVDAELVQRLDGSALTNEDVQLLVNGKPVRPSRWSEYVYDRDDDAGAPRLWSQHDPVVPFALIDARLFDLAQTFWDGPDDRLLKGYRRLEDIVRSRTGLDSHSAKLFSQAFQGKPPRLTWPDCADSETSGRAQLFGGAFMAYRNPRAHRELTRGARELLREFLLLNHLYLLEAEAEEHCISAEAAGT